MGTSDRRAQGLAARPRRQRPSDGLRALDARARRRDRRVSDRPLRRDTRAARARTLGGRTPPRPSRCAAATTSRATSPTHSRSSQRTTSSATAEAVESVVTSFETREEFLEDVPVADTALVLAMLARRRDIDEPLPASPMLPVPDQSVSPCAIVGMERDGDRLLRMRLVLELGQLLDQLVRAARAPCRRRASCAPARSGTRPPPRRGRSRAAARAAARPAPRSRGRLRGSPGRS